MTGAPDPTRRPLKTRSTAWAKALARWLARIRVSPNAISLASVVFAGAAGAALLFSGSCPTSAGKIWLLVGAAAGIQLRLLCNMLDGMVAVEGDRRSKTGDLYNEIPDRIADALILVGAGYGAALPWSTELGWIAALLAVLTAYIRALGRSLGTAMMFQGPMAKPQRMFVMTLAAIAGACTVPWMQQTQILRVALALVALGSLITCMRRACAIAAELKRA